MSADEFRLLVVRWFWSAVVVTAVVLIWPHLHPVWLYGVIGLIVALVNPYRPGLRAAVAAKEAKREAEIQRKTIV